jgi:uncharacterized protein YjdB
MIVIGWSYDSPGGLDDRGSEVAWTNADPSPAIVAGLTVVTAMAAGTFPSSAPLSRGAVECPRCRSQGRLSDETTTHSSTRVMVAS